MKRSVLSTRAGFSLIEIILALGIISFTLVGILGLFPVAVNAAADSQHETQAALIARSLFDQLESNPGSTVRSIRLAEKFDAETPAPIKVDLSKTGDSDPIGFDPDGKALSSADYLNASYQAVISVTPITTPNYGLSQVVITVTKKPSKYSFVSILPQK